MSVVSLRNSRGHMIEVESVTATIAKNTFGAILDKAVAGGIVAITKRDKPRAVVISMEEYQALQARVSNPLQGLHREFDALVARMQKPRARAAGNALFAATSGKLGAKSSKSLTVGARKRG